MSTRDFDPGHGFRSACMTPLQQALASVSHEEAQAIFEALDQFTVNNVEPLELTREELSEGVCSLTAAEVERQGASQEAGLEVLDRMNANLAGLAG